MFRCLLRLSVKDSFEFYAQVLLSSQVGWKIILTYTNTIPPSLCNIINIKNQNLLVIITNKQVKGGTYTDAVPLFALLLRIARSVPLLNPARSHARSVREPGRRLGQVIRDFFEKLEISLRSFALW